MDIISSIEAILFAAGDSVPIARLSLILELDEKEIEEAGVYVRTKDISVISLFLVHRVGNCAVVFGPGQLIWVPTWEPLTL